MSELLIIIICVALCCFSFRLGIFYREWIATQKVEEYLKSLELMQKEVQKYVVHIHITKENDTFYVYNETTGEFLAQGKDHKEIVEVLRKRYPQSTFTATPENLVATGFKLQDDAF